MPKISVIVPVYKVEQYIHRCIDSILNQTFSDFELILVDDGSPDNCGKICDEYAKKDTRIKVIHKENGGLSDARNAGLDVAKGEYIGFVDSDDWIHPQMYEIYYKLALQNNVDIVASQLTVYDDIDTEKVNFDEISNNAEVVEASTIYKHYFSEYFNKYWVSAWCKIYKREIFDNIRFEKGRIFEDVLVVIPILLAAKKVCLLDKCLYYYNNKSDSIVRSKFSEKIFDTFYVIEKRCAYFKNNKNEFNLGMVEWYYNYTEFAIFTSLYAPQYRKNFKPYRRKMIKNIFLFLNNSHLCKLYKFTTLLTFINPKISEKICKKYFQNITQAVNSFRKRL